MTFDPAQPRSSVRKGWRLKRPRVDPFLTGIILSVLAAIVLPARGIAAPLVGHAVTAGISLLFFLYGARLSPAAIGQGLSHWRLQGLTFAATFVVFPMIGLVIASAVRPMLPADLDTGLLYLCLLPSTVQSSIAFTAIAGGNVAAALCSASLSNIVGMAMTPLLVALLMGAAGAAISAHGMIEIAVQLLLPFVLGQIARPFIGAWLLRHAKWTGVIDRWTIFLIVYSAFSEGVVSGIWTQLTPLNFVIVALSDGVILALILTATTQLSRLSRFAREDEIAVVFCGSKKGIAAGISMANILFAGHGIGLILLPAMLFHQIQLFACATLARRYARQRPEALVA